MKLCVLLCFVAYAAVVLSRRCEQGNVALCTNITCSNSLEAVACEHDICTCALKPQACLQIGDCTGTCAKHDEVQHCLDSACICMKPH